MNRWSSCCLNRRLEFDRLGSTAKREPEPHLPTDDCLCVSMTRLHPHPFFSLLPIQGVIQMRIHRLPWTYSSTFSCSSGSGYSGFLSLNIILRCSMQIEEHRIYSIPLWRGTAAQERMRRALWWHAIVLIKTLEFNFPIPKFYIFLH